jgi:hypothetical protein
MAQLAHLQMLSVQWAPLVVLALDRYVETRRRRWLVLVGVAWLLQALSKCALFFLSVFVGLWPLFRRAAAALADPGPRGCDPRRVNRAAAPSCGPTRRPQQLHMARQWWRSALTRSVRGVRPMRSARGAG